MKTEVLLEALERISKFNQIVKRPCTKPHGADAADKELTCDCGGFAGGPPLLIETKEPTPSAKIAIRALESFKS